LARNGKACKSQKRLRASIPSVEFAQFRLEPTKFSLHVP
jgi:hypothetical protein